MGKTVAVYVRAGQEISMKTQAMRVREYCEKKEYTIADSVSVVGDRNLGVRLLMEMLDTAKEKGIDTVVMDSTDRIARSVTEMVETQNEIQKAGCSIETLDGSHQMIGALAAISAMAEAEERKLEENTELVFGYDVTQDGLEVNEAEAEVVKFIFERTQELSANPPEDLVRAIVEEYHGLGKEISTEEAAEKVSHNAIMLRVEHEVKEQWPDQYDDLIRKQNHNRELAAKRTLSTQHTIDGGSLKPIIDAETWNKAQERIEENFDNSGPQMGGMSM